MNTPHVTFTRLLLAAMSLSAVLSPLAAQSAAPAPAGNPTHAALAPRWIGTYTGNGLELVLRSDGAGGVTGSLAFDGLNCVVTAARVERDRLEGVVQVGADPTAFAATRAGPNLGFVIGGTEHLLRPSGVSPASPAPAPIVPAPRPAPAGPDATAAAPAGTLVRVSLGFSLQLPAGWTSEETSDGLMMLPPGVRFDPRRTDNPEVYLALLRDDYDTAGEAQVVRQLSAALVQGGARGGQRQAGTFGRRPGATYRWDFADPRTGRPASLDVHLAIEGRKAAVLLGTGERDRVRAQDSALRRILASVDFTAPAWDEAGGLADATPLAQRWLQKLRGRLVRQFWASQGMSSDKKHWLNADGSYSFRSEGMVSIDVPGASALSTDQGDSTGRWRIRDLAGEVFLEVRYRNGTVRRMPITEDGRNWLLNGEKAFAVDPE